MIIHTNQVYLLKLLIKHLAMKRLISIFALALITVSLHAQNNTTCAIVGTHYNADGELVISDPSTTLQVQITVVKEQIIVGPYAKYAQRHLDVRPSLVERTTYSVSNAKISILGEVTEPKYNDKKHTKANSYLGSDTEFARVSAERMSSSVMSIEDAAEQAAQTIFSIRRHRMELITGEAGENVFGAGLKDALKTLDEKEQEYLELFLGKKITTTSTHTYTIPLALETTEYPLARIKSQTGLQPATAADGDVVKLVLVPSATTPKLNYINEVEGPSKLATAVRIANMSTCSVMVKDKIVGTTTLPIFELGRTAYILTPIKK